MKGKRFVTMSESNEYGNWTRRKSNSLRAARKSQLVRCINRRSPSSRSLLSGCPVMTSLWLQTRSLVDFKRIKVVEFNRHFSPEEQDTHLKDELCEQSSMSGIFMWLVRGYIRYKERGLTMSGNLKEVVKKYEREQRHCVAVP